VTWSLRAFSFRDAAYIHNHQIKGGAKDGAGEIASPRKGTKMNLTRSFNNWRKYRQTVTELGRMSSRELQDLGINRADIQSVARQSVAR
jgi:uncharacterized protein YjiS (DUF1127 family)